MKKLLVISALFLLFGCSEFSKKIEEIIPNQKIEENQEPETHHQFESRNLKTPISKLKKVKVALFLPLSGKNQELGENIANAAIMSVFENDHNKNIELVLVDSKEEKKETKKAFIEGIVKKDIKIVIGPVFSSSIDEIEREVLKNEITAISLSNNKESFEKINSSGGIFIAGIMSETQIDRIVTHSIKQGKTNFAVIAPNNQYGNLVTKIFKNIVKNRNANFLTAEFYRLNNMDMSRAVDRVINSFTISKEAKLALKNDKNYEITEDDKRYPDVIFIPESGKILSKILYYVKNQNINEREFQIVGTNALDDPIHLQDDNLIGALFSAPSNESFLEFQKRYYQNYNSIPLRISSISYDMINAVIKMTTKKMGQAPNLKDFTNYSSSSRVGFDGVDGPFRFIPNGLLQRNLAILQIEDNYFKTIDPSLDRFLEY